MKAAAGDASSRARDCTNAGMRRTRRQPPSPRTTTRTLHPGRGSGGLGGTAAAAGSAISAPRMACTRWLPAPTRVGGVRTCPVRERVCPCESSAEMLVGA